MKLVDTLTYEQKNQLISVLNSYKELLKKTPNNTFLQKRIYEIEEELKPKEKTIKIHEW